MPQKDLHNLVRSRNARLNLARRQAAAMVEMLDPEKRPINANDEAWSVLFAEIRDMAQDALQGAHEASAYHNALMGSDEIVSPSSNGRTPHFDCGNEGSSPSGELAAIMAEICDDKLDPLR